MTADNNNHPTTPPASGTGFAPAPPRLVLPADPSALAVLRDTLADYLSLLERNTATLERWLNENEEPLIGLYHDIRTAIKDQDGATLATHLLRTPETTGFIFQTTDILADIRNAFTDDADVAAALQHIPDGFLPSVLENMDDILHKLVTPAAEPVAPVFPADRTPQDVSNKTPADKKTGVFSGLARIFGVAGNPDDKTAEETARAAREDAIREQWQTVYNEMQTLQSSRHYYIDATMDYLLAGFTAPAEDAENTTRIQQQYRDPQYILDRATKDYADVLTHKTRHIAERTQRYHDLHDLFTTGDENDIKSRFEDLLTEARHHNSNMLHRLFRENSTLGDNVIDYIFSRDFSPDARDRMLQVLKAHLSLADYRTMLVDITADNAEKILRHLIDYARDSTVKAVTFNEIYNHLLNQAASDMPLRNAVHRLLPEILGEHILSHTATAARILKTVLKGNTAQTIDSFATIARLMPILRDGGATPDMQADYIATVTDMMPVLREGAETPDMEADFIAAVANIDSIELFKKFWNLHSDKSFWQDVTDLAYADYGTAIDTDAAFRRIAAVFDKGFHRDEESGNVVEIILDLAFNTWNDKDIPATAVAMASEVLGDTDENWRAAIAENGGLLERALLADKDRYTETFIKTHDLPPAHTSSFTLEILDTLPDNIARHAVLKLARENTTNDKVAGYLDALIVSDGRAPLWLDDNTVIVDPLKLSVILVEDGADNAADKLYDIQIVTDGTEKSTLLPRQTLARTLDILSALETHCDHLSVPGELYRPENISLITVTAGTAYAHWQRHSIEIEIAAEKNGLKLPDYLEQHPDFLVIRNGKEALSAFNLQHVAYCEKTEDGFFIIDKYGADDNITGTAAQKINGPMIAVKDGAWLNPMAVSRIDTHGKTAQNPHAVTFRIESDLFRKTLKKVRGNHTLDKEMFIIDDVPDVAPLMERISHSGTNTFITVKEKDRAVHFNMPVLQYMITDDKKHSLCAATRVGIYDAVMPLEKDIYSGIVAQLKSNRDIITYDNAHFYAQSLDNIYYHAEQKAVYFVSGRNVIKRPAGKNVALFMNTCMVTHQFVAAGENALALPKKDKSVSTDLLNTHHAACYRIDNAGHGKSIGFHKDIDINITPAFMHAQAPQTGYAEKLARCFNAAGQKPANGNTPQQKKNARKLDT